MPARHLVLSAYKLHPCHLSRGVQKNYSILLLTKPVPVSVRNVYISDLNRLPIPGKQCKTQGKTIQ